MLGHTRAIAVGIFVLGLALGAQAGPAMFNGSFIWHAFGNDITSGTQYPYNTYSVTAIPLGHDCQETLPYSENGAPNDRYCFPTTFQEGMPATGSGYLVSGGATLGGPIGLAPSAITIVASGFNATYYPYLQSHTSANFVNDAGAFFAGGGAAAGLGQVTKTGMGQRAGTWIIHEGDRGFGGAMGLLGFYGVKRLKWIVPGKVGTYINSPSDWNMVYPLGRPRFGTVYSYTPMGTEWFNPHQITDSAINNVNGNVSVWTAYGTGTLWTTGSVTVYALEGVALPTIHRRAGYDIVTAGGVRNIQLVTPELTHWNGTGWLSHTGAVGILKLQITPEPGAILMLAAGGGLLALLHGVSRRRRTLR